MKNKINTTPVPFTRPHPLHSHPICTKYKIKQKRKRRRRRGKHTTTT